MTGNCTEHPFDIDSPTAQGNRGPLLVAQGLHLLNREVHAAVTGRDETALRRLALQHMHPAIGALAVSLGSGGMASRLTPWVISSLLDWLDVPLFVSANILDHLSILRSSGPRIVINAVTADPAHLARAMQAAGQYGAGLTVLLVRAGLTPCGVDDRLTIAGEVLDQAYRIGLPFSRLYLDPVLACRPDPFALRISRGLPDIGPAAESISLIKELDTGVGTMVGLGTGTQELGGQKPFPAQLSMLSLLRAAGLDAAIVNSRNKLLMTALINNMPTVYIDMAEKVRLRESFTI